MISDDLGTPPAGGRFQTRAQQPPSPPAYAPASRRQREETPFTPAPPPRQPRAPSAAPVATRPPCASPAPRDYQRLPEIARGCPRLPEITRPPPAPRCMLAVARVRNMGRSGEMWGDRLACMLEIAASASSALAGAATASLLPACAAAVSRSAAAAASICSPGLLVPTLAQPRNLEGSSHAVSSAHGTWLGQPRRSSLSSARLKRGGPFAASRCCI